MKILEATGLTKRYGGREVVRGVGLRVAPGEIVGLLGPNGAGKTTAFEMILGLVEPEAGSVTFGAPLDGLPLHKRARLGLGYLPQGASVFRGLSVRDNLLVILETLKKPDPKARAADLLARFDLTKLATQKAFTLSGGERRRLELARALCSDPSVILVDEPFAGVDPIAVAEISTIITGLARDGVGVLLTDHSVRSALTTCDRIYLIVEGEILEEGAPDEIRRSPLARRVYLGESFD